MLKRQSRHLALLLVLTMLATLFVGVGTAQAKSLNSVNKVITVADGTDTDGLGIKFSLKEDSDFVTHFVYGETFTLKLPTGAKWLSGATAIDGPATAVKRTDQVLEVTFSDAVDMGSSSTPDIVTVPMLVEFDGASGDIEVTVDPLDSAVTGGSYVFARISEGKLSASVDKVKKIGKSGDKGGVIELRENIVGACKKGVEVTLKIKLPGNFVWESKPVVKGAAGFGNLTASDFTVTGTGERSAIIKFTPVATTPSQRGILYIETPIKAERDASLGEIEVGISGESSVESSLIDADLVVAEYVDWGVTAKVAEVEELIAGKFDQKTAKITLEENIAGTLLTGRDVTLELPEWVKITDVKLSSGTDYLEVCSHDGKKNYVDLRVKDKTSTSTKKIEFKLHLSIEGNKSGDIEAKIYGAGIEETSLVIAKAIAPVVPSIEKVNEVKIGIQSQPLADLTIVEGKKDTINYEYQVAPEAFAIPNKWDADGNVIGTYYTAKNGAIALSLTEGAKFAATPTVTVTDGNLEIRKADVRVTGDNDERVTIPIKSESTKISTIKVSDIKITCNRAVPEGDLKIKVGGTAVIENSRSAGPTENIDAGEFTVGSIPVVAAKVITPADTNIHAVATYVIGNTIYQINGVDQAAMDQPPYIKNDRTFLPIRFVAYGLGIGDNGIIWDQVNKTVTLMKNDKVVQLEIGSTTMKVNGVSITMDAAPEITAANRTCLPIRFVAEAFGAVVGWDAATQTVTVTL